MGRAVQRGHDSERGRRRECDHTRLHYALFHLCLEGGLISKNKKKINYLYLDTVVFKARSLWGRVNLADLCADDRVIKSL